MTLVKPIDDETVWVEYPEGMHFEAVYNASADTYTPRDGHPIAAKDIANWSRQEHEDTDISDDPRQASKGKLTRS
jgi:hypothetical protein